MRRSLATVGAGVLVAACGGGTSGPGPAPTPAPAAATVMRQAAQAAQAPPPVAAEPPKPKDIDPTGMYSVSLTYGGQPLALTLQIAKRADGSYGGAISVDQVPDPIPLQTVSVTGKTVSATLNSPDGASVSLEFTVEGADVTGSYRTSTGDGSAITGKKIP